MTALPIDPIAMRHVGNADHPATDATCEAVSDAQADYLETLGWVRVTPPEPEVVPTIPDTADGLEHDTEALAELAGLTEDELAQLAVFADALTTTDPEPTDQTDRDATSRRGTRRQTPEEG